MGADVRWRKCSSKWVGPSSIVEGGSVLRSRNAISKSNNGDYSRVSWDLMLVLTHMQKELM